MVVMEPMVPMELWEKVKNKLGSSYGRERDKNISGSNPEFYSSVTGVFS